MTSIKHIRLLIGLLLLVQTRAAAAEPFTPTSQYERRQLEGWCVLVNQHLLTDQRQLGYQALTLLADKLQLIKRVVPAKACKQLQTVPIWLGIKDGHAPCSEYHYSREWLKTNGYNPDKAKSVEIGNAELFIQWSADQPMMVLHELAHAYQDQRTAEEKGQIEALYQHALKSGLYQSVPRNNGTSTRAYALTNDREYFAESSEAFFGRNDFYPFDRKELAHYDPGMYDLLTRIWNE